MTRYDRFKNHSYCVGGRDHSSTINIKPATSFNQKTGEEVKLFKSDWSMCKRTEPKIVSDNTIEADGFGNFDENFGKRAAKHLLK